MRRVRVLKKIDRLEESSCNCRGWLLEAFVEQVGPLAELQWSTRPVPWQQESSFLGTLTLASADRNDFRGNKINEGNSTYIGGACGGSLLCVALHDPHQITSQQ